MKRNVLILIVVEDGLVRTPPSVNGSSCRVLILIVVEDGLVHDKNKFIHKHSKRLNPYCSGRWSRTQVNHSAMSASQVVLILIVVEDGLVLDLIRLF